MSKVHPALILCLLYSSVIVAQAVVDPPRHTVLFILDGMAAGTLERLDLTNLEGLQAKGVYYPKVELILPAHPAQDDRPDSPYYYPWGCSLPNIPLMTGALFVGAEALKAHMIQHSFGDAFTGFVVNDSAYRELRYGFDVYYRHGSTLDDQYDYQAVREKAQELIAENDARFIRIHFQGPGSGGYLDLQEGVTIWEEGSRYRREMMRADAEVGAFVDWLEKSGRWSETVLIVMGDHGQNHEGWHAPYVGQAQRQPVIFVGKGIKKGKTFTYAEAIDIAPTIAFLNQVPAPAYSQGRVLKEVLTGHPDHSESPRYLWRLNATLLAYHHMIEAKESGDEAHTPTLSGSRPFLPLRTIGTWHRRFDSLAELVAYQESVLEDLLANEQNKK